MPTLWNYYQGQRVINNKEKGESCMGCYHIEYTGGTYNCYRCKLSGKTWDWGDAHVEFVCKCGEEYRKCPIWRK